MKTQIVLIVSCILLLFGLYFFGTTVKHDKTKPTTSSGGDLENFDINAFLERDKQRLMLIPKDSINDLEEKLSKAKTSAEKVNISEQIVNIWENNNKFASASEIRRRIAQSDSTAERWFEAGDAMFNAFKITPDSAVNAYLLRESQIALEHAVNLDTNNLDYAIRLAETHVDGTNNVMAGVTLLLDVVKKDPENNGANLILGRLSIISGQYEKAFQRLNGILERDPNNAEAMFYIAGAYEGTGQKDKAREYFERCKTLVKNPAFRAEIDKYLEKLNKK